MKKIIVIGCPGSGKSTFSRALNKKIGIPLYYLDMMYWNADKTIVEKGIFRSRLASVLEKEKWIIDGNYGSTMEQRIIECDTVFMLDYTTEVCLVGIRNRRGKKRDDMPWIETEEDYEFNEFIKGFNEEQRPRILDLLKKYHDKNIIIFKSREDADKFLSEEI